MKKSILLLDGDIQLINGNIVLITNEDRVRQLIENALSIRKGEWFYNTETGLSHDELFKKRPDLETLEFDIIQTITSLQEVEEVTDLTINYDSQDRAAIINFNVTYDLGNLEMEVII